MMKKILLLAGLLVSTVVLTAQELTVQTFKLSKNDLEAKTNPVYDGNKEACALIKVAIVGDDVTFEGAVVKSYKHIEGEYFVYMPAGYKRLKVYKKGYLPLTVDFQNYDVKLEKNLTYELRILTPEQDKVIPKLERQYLVMNVRPVIASVYIDDVVREVDAEGQVAVELQCGTHNYRVESFGFITEEGVVQIDPSDKTEMTVALKSNTGVIKVESPSVEDANVFINGEPCGTTPFTSENLKSGQYDVKVTKAGYYVFSKSVTLKAGDNQTVVAEMKPSFSSVRFKAPSDQTSVYLDGKLLSKGDWEGAIDPGQHLVELKQDGFADASKVIDVKTGSNEEIVLPELFPLYGVLNIMSTPMGASVSLDDKKIGTTPLKTNQVTVGKHILLVEKAEYKPEKFEIEVIKDSTVSCNLQLSKINSKPDAHVVKAENIPVATKPVENKPAEKAKDAAPKEQGHFFVGGVAGLNPTSFGPMLGYAGKFGAYVKYKSNFKSFTADYECASYGKISGQYVLTTQKQIVSVSNFTAGAVLSISDKLYLYAGAGFGSFRLGWEDINKKWIEVTDYTFKGIAVSGGAIYRMGSLGLSVGSNITAFKVADLELGLSVWL